MIGKTNRKRPPDEAGQGKFLNVPCSCGGKLELLISEDPVKFGDHVFQRCTETGIITEVAVGKQVLHKHWGFVSARRIPLEEAKSKLRKRCNGTITSS